MFSFCVIVSYATAFESHIGQTSSYKKYIFCDRYATYVTHSELSNWQPHCNTCRKHWRIRLLRNKSCHTFLNYADITNATKMNRSCDWLWRPPPGDGGALRVAWRGLTGSVAVIGGALIGPTRDRSRHCGPIKSRVCSIGAREATEAPGHLAARRSGERSWRSSRLTVTRAVDRWGIVRRMCRWWCISDVCVACMLLSSYAVAGTRNGRESRDAVTHSTHVWRIAAGYRRIVSVPW